MRPLCCCMLSILLPVCVLGQAPRFGDYFEDATMRIDYYHTANAVEEEINIDQIYIRDRWAGNPRKRLPNWENGKHTVTLIDTASNQPIYSHHLLTIVFEYKGTKDAQAGRKKTYHQTAQVPYPKRPVLLTIEQRDRQNIRHLIFSRIIDPNDVDLRKEPPARTGRSFVVLENGPAHDKVDLVFIAEGYETKDFHKFKSDTQRYSDYLFTIAPFDRLKDRFNVRGVFRASAQTGVDFPTRGTYKNTVMNASYNTLGASRYCTINSNRAMRDIAECVPYDFIIVLVNSPRYGGGGFYNDYCLFTADDKRSAEIFTHEFGHSFAGLADEYVKEDYFDVYYVRGIEPLEPNITAYLNPRHIKWAHLLTPGLPLPTPPEEQHDLKVGLFEGAGYTRTGMYRSCLHCVMGAGGLAYCQACQEAIAQVINHYSN